QQPSPVISPRLGSGLPSHIRDEDHFLVREKRMVKKQQMRWTPRGAHLLLQIRTRVLNDDLDADFHRWYPGFTHTTTDRHDLAA
ncbi:MAG: hypothetical protein ACRDRQ_09685, partial [Pseudonocardiaceae bacterium]